MLRPAAIRTLRPAARRTLRPAALRTLRLQSRTLRATQARRRPRQHIILLARHCLRRLPTHRPRCLHRRPVMYRVRNPRSLHHPQLQLRPAHSLRLNFWLMLPRKSQRRGLSPLSPSVLHYLKIQSTNSTLSVLPQGWLQEPVDTVSPRRRSTSPPSLALACL